MKCLNAVRDAFYAAWPQKRRHAGGYASYTEFSTGEKFLASMADSIDRESLNPRMNCSWTGPTGFRATAWPIDWPYAEVWAGVQRSTCG